MLFRSAAPAVATELWRLLFAEGLTGEPWCKLLTTEEVDGTRPRTAVWGVSGRGRLRSLAGVLIELACCCCCCWAKAFAEPAGLRFTGDGTFVAVLDVGTAAELLTRAALRASSGIEGR